ncbi:hypothetical protein VTJ83DRAFT_1401 [Remersonia thermophila]|uniref:Yeast cell wall synthesis Kre9/Knh1-like N-terminal domain-containing protein n=1 Tax=Remersonia thermophila TaxID=72144 RepID=A0ABR4DNW4_9PEZI
MRTTATLTALLSLLATCARAVQITSPTKDASVDFSSGVTVRWSTVSTDPSRARLVLVSMAAGHTPFRRELSDDVDLSQGSLTVAPQADVAADSGYQFNFESVEPGNLGGILAQSPQFKVVRAAAEDDDDDKDLSTTATTRVTATVTISSARRTSTSSTAADGAPPPPPPP